MPSANSKETKRQHKKMRIGLKEKDDNTETPNFTGTERCLKLKTSRNHAITNPGMTRMSGKSRKARLDPKMPWIVKLDVRGLINQAMKKLSNPLIKNG